MSNINFRAAVKMLKKNKSYTLVNTIGFGLGITCIILIFTLVRYHLSFDTFHSKADRIYRIVTEIHRDEISYVAGTPQPLGKAFQNDFSLAEKVGRLYMLSDQLITINSSHDNKIFQEPEGIALTEPAFFDILDFPLLAGDKASILAEPGTVVITQRLAQKYFGGQNPIGQTIQVSNHLNLRVSGVLRNLPTNTDIRQEIFISYANLKDIDPDIPNDEWGTVARNLQCFVLLKSNITPYQADKALSVLSKKYYPEEEALKYQFRVQPISDIHFNPNFEGKIAKRSLWGLSLIGLFLVVTACMNFINLATAKALGRAKEIGVRKVLGSERNQLFQQFMCETALIIMLAMTLAFVSAKLSLPYVNELFHIQLQINLFNDLHIATFLFLLFLALTFFSGVYPALLMAGFQPVYALKGKLSQKSIGGISLRRGLIISQFAISQLLIIGSIVITKQMHYATQTDLGFQKEAIAILPIPGGGKAKLDAFNLKLSQIAGVKASTSFRDAPASLKGISSPDIRYDSRPEYENFSLSIKAGDDRYIPTFGLQIVAGRNILPSDTVREFVLNETMVKQLGVKSNEEVIGKEIRLVTNNYKGTVVGVVKDFYAKSFHEAIEPLCITSPSDWYSNAAIKISPTSLSTSMEAIEKIWKETFPDQVYRYSFLDEQIGQFYKQESILLRLIQFFTGIAILIGCLGLYSLVSYMAARKIKEVGVRKVLGASVKRIVWLFGKEFIQLLLIAFLVAAPLGWWIMHTWLDGFVYRIQIGIGVFGLTVLITLLVAIMTVGYQSLKAALADPIKSLKSE